ncbi:MAG: DNA helicase [Microbacteriaceae bacterium]
MGLSRKRQKELARLRRDAEELWGNQQVVLDHAGHVAREAGRQLGNINRELVVPRVQAGYESYLQPRLRWAGDRLEHDVLPAVGRTLGAVLSVGDVAREARIRRALGRISPALAPVEPKKSRVGLFIGLGFVFTIVGALGYAAWSTFRADDELWIADDSDV